MNIEMIVTAHTEERGALSFTVNGEDVNAITNVTEGTPSAAEIGATMHAAMARVDHGEMTDIVFSVQFERVK